MKLRVLTLSVLLAILLGLAACGTPALPTLTPLRTAIATETPVPRSHVDEVNFTTDDEVKLSGTLFGGGEIAVILAHMGTEGTDQQSWHPFARLLAERGFTALALDFRGRGKSEGYMWQAQLVRDVRAAAEFLQDRGFERIVCMGASMGGTSCLKLALEEDLAGLVVIASPMSLGYPTNVSRADFPSLTMPKLFVCAEDDRYGGLAEAATEMYELSPEPKEIRLFSGMAHGTELFDTAYGDEFTGLLLDFLEGLR